MWDAAKSVLSMSFLALNACIRREIPNQYLQLPYGKPERQGQIIESKQKEGNHKDKEMLMKVKKKN